MRLSTNLLASLHAVFLPEYRRQRGGWTIRIRSATSLSILQGLRINFSCTLNLEAVRMQLPEYVIPYETAGGPKSNIIPIQR
jgi:hypothetical protein